MYTTERVKVLHKISSLIGFIPPKNDEGIDRSTLAIPLSVDIPVVGLERLEPVECESEPV